MVVSSLLTLLSVPLSSTSSVLQFHLVLPPVRHRTVHQAAQAVHQFLRVLVTQAMILVTLTTLNHPIRERDNLTAPATTLVQTTLLLNVPLTSQTGVLHHSIYHFLISITFGWVSTMAAGHNSTVAAVPVATSVELLLLHHTVTHWEPPKSFKMVPSTAITPPTPTTGSSHLTDLMLSPTQQTEARMALHMVNSSPTPSTAGNSCTKTLPSPTVSTISTSGTSSQEPAMWPMDPVSSKPGPIPSLSSARMSTLILAKAGLNTVNLGKQAQTMHMSSSRPTAPATRSPLTSTVSFLASLLVRLLLSPSSYRT